MARAKRTDRAEARRRYRASLEAQSVATEDGEDLAEPNTLTSVAEPNRLGRARHAILGRQRAKPADPLATAPPLKPQPGLMGAIKGAIRPVHYREDFAALPALALHSRAIWLPGVLVLVAGILALVPGLMTTNAIAQMYVSLFLYPPMAAPFLAGILAPRAGWLAGYVVSLFAGILVGVAVLRDPASAGSAPTVVLDAFIVMPIFGAFVGGFAAFYKRFLKLSNANAARNRASSANRSKRPAQAKAAARR